MAPRANWKGYLRLSLVSCPILLYPATSETEKVHFHQLNKETGNRIHLQKVDAETGKAVPAEDTCRDACGVDSISRASWHSPP
jgi:DNA end-binding protein Ku